MRSASASLRRTTGRLPEEIVLDPAELASVLEPADRIHLEVEARDTISLHENDAVAHDLGPQDR